MKVGRRQDVKEPVADQSIRVSKRTLKKLREHKLGWRDSYNYVIERSLDFLDLLDPDMKETRLYSYTRVQRKPTDRWGPIKPQT